RRGIGFWRLADGDRSLQQGDRLGRFALLDSGLADVHQQGCVEQMVNAMERLVDPKGALEERKRTLVLAGTEQRRPQAVEQRDQIGVLGTERLLVDGDRAFEAA